MPYLLRLWFGVVEPVDRQAYALSGLGLATLKYALEALIIWLITAQVFPPWQFVNPVFSMRVGMLGPAATWVGLFLLAFSLPFLWVAISMSVRRASDAGFSPWTGLLVLIPLVNLFSMVAMCLAPSLPQGGWKPRSRLSETTPPAKSGDAGSEAALSLGLSLVFGAAMLLFTVYLLGSYGSSLFVGTPLMMGVLAGYLYNRRVPRSYMVSVGLGFGSILGGACGLLLFALEGLICVVMALPLLLPLGVVGGLLGKAIADSTRRSSQELLAVVMMLPVLAMAETQWVRTSEYSVTTTVEIDAPGEVVWDHVIDFPDLPPPKEWSFRIGIACPERARITGTGPGATRFCEFSTGTFVEPITVWDQPHRLAFNVTEQPAPMFELSPYRHVHPPHLHGYLRSNRGEFRLVELPQGRTRLEGQTWYEFEMFPQAYWTLWSDLFIEQIHRRVLLHIKHLAERTAADQH